MTIHEAFKNRLENEDGTVSIHLNSVAWSRCFGVMYEIAHELVERDDRRSEGESD
jgi:hypothetical protein